MKIAFVLPWFGKFCVGGAEREAKNTALNLQKAGFEVEILTTCCKDLHSNWNENFYPTGVNLEQGLVIRRFPVRKSDHERFNKILNFIRWGKKITPEEEKIFALENIRSLELNQFIKENNQNYDFFIFIPYLFGTTIDGAELVPEKSILIPCLHDENFARLKIFERVFKSFKAIVFHTFAEKKLAQKIYGIDEKKGEVLGEGVAVDVIFKKSEFKRKYHLESPYLLFVGRKDEGKNLPLIINYFEKYKRIFKNDLKLVLIGFGKAGISSFLKNEVLDLGYINEQEKLNAYADAFLTVQPSLYESFSLVLMESWICEVPVLVNGFCDVTKEHCLKSQGGLFFENFSEFAEAINLFLENPKLRKKMGENGKKYVFENFRWDKIVERYKKFFEKLK